MKEPRYVDNQYSNRAEIPSAIVVFVYQNIEIITLNRVFIFRYVEDAFMDLNQFCRFNILQIVKFCILQSSQKCRFSCSAASHYYASNMPDCQLFFA